MQRQAMVGIRFRDGRTVGYDPENDSNGDRVMKRRPNYWDGSSPRVSITGGSRKYTPVKMYDIVTPEIEKAEVKIEKHIEIKAEEKEPAIEKIETPAPPVEETKPEVETEVVEQVVTDSPAIEEKQEEPTYAAIDSVLLNQFLEEKKNEFMGMMPGMTVRKVFDNLTTYLYSHATQRYPNSDHELIDAMIDGYLNTLLEKEPDEEKQEKEPKVQEQKEEYKDYKPNRDGKRRNKGVNPDKMKAANNF